MTGRVLTFAIGLFVAVVAALALFEITMRPSGAERTQLFVLFVSIAVATAVLGWVLVRLTPRFRSLRIAVLIIAVAAVGAVSVATGIAARLMFIEPHDLQLLTVVLGFGVGLAVVLATALAKSLTADLDAIRVTAVAVADGDLASRTGVVRPDELGDVARAVDAMAQRLGDAAAERDRVETSRRHLLAAVGHDLRSPLAALQAAVEALEDGLAPDPQRYFRAMRSDLDAMRHLVDDLFLLSTIEAGMLDLDLEWVDLAELADDSIEAMRPVAAVKSVELTLDADGGVAAEGGPWALGRVIRNLLHNAIRYTPEQSAVVVSVSRGPGSSSDRHVGSPGSVLVVRDQGPGFAPDALAGAFDEFVTGDPARSRVHGGAGLGLAIAKGIVAAHGGEIWAEPGPGGTVGFRLPG